MARNVRNRVEAAAFRGLMALPRPLMRRLAGPPVVVDGQTLDLETQWLLRLRQVAREPAAETLPFPDGRRLITRSTRLTGGRRPIGQVRDLVLPGADGPVPARLYVPRSQVSRVAPDSAREPSPLLVFLHGGGFMYGDLDSHDPACRVLAERADVRVLALDYRLAPEHRFPAAVDDCWAAYQWAVEHADELGADPDRIGVGGDSAGGCLATVVAMRAANAGVPCRHQLLVYPVTDMVTGSESRRLFGSGFFLTQEFIDLADATYLADPGERHHPDVSPALTEKIPEGLAPATVVTAGFDPLRDEGEAWARTLADAGVEVRLTRYPGFIHGFLCVVGVGRTQRAAVAEIAARLKAALH
ncbi:MAG TPA: alpha/beta hydrolase [Pedococcus sp.]